MNQHQNANKIISELNGMLFLQAYANKSMKQNVENI